MIRIVLIIGACLCFVIGVNWICEHIVYHVTLDPVMLAINAFAFVPLFALGPRYKNGLAIYWFIGLAEALVIVMGNLLTLK